MLCYLFVMKTQNKNRWTKNWEKKENQIELTSLSKFHSKIHIQFATQFFNHLFIKFSYDRSSSVVGVFVNLKICTNQTKTFLFWKTYHTKMFTFTDEIYSVNVTESYTQFEFESTSIHMEHQTVTERGKSMRERIQHSDTLNFGLVYFRFSST